MAINASVIQNVLFVRWVDEVTVADVEEIKVCLERAHHKVGDGLVYLAIIPRDSAPPDTEARAALRDGTDFASGLCRSVNIVIEGAGFRRALIRSVSAGLLLATFRRSKGFKIHETVHSALESALEDDEDSVEHIMSIAATRGLLTVTESGSVAPEAY